MPTYLKISRERFMFTETYEYIIRTLQTTYCEITIMKEKLMMEKNIEEILNTNENTDDTTTMIDPPTSKCKGRPSNRYKSLLKNDKNKKRAKGRPLIDLK